jgi:peptide methionine sulfoxide reductase msrA/msrB
MKMSGAKWCCIAAAAVAVAVWSVSPQGGSAGAPSGQRPTAPAAGEERMSETTKATRAELRKQLDPGYCINSASLRFVPVADLEKEGYGTFLPHFGRPAPKPAVAAQEQTATLAGGCFWGMQELLRKQPGVIRSQAGYTGGVISNATYKHHEGHAEAVRLWFDPAKTTYGALVRFFFRMHDPTTLNRQGNDRGRSYRSAIFFHDEEQRKVAERVKAEVDASGKWKNPIVTEIVPAGPWWKAEEYHQDYLQKNPGGYTCHWVRD